MSLSVTSPFALQQSRQPEWKQIKEWANSLGYAICPGAYELPFHVVPLEQYGPDPDRCRRCATVFQRSYYSLKAVKQNKPARKSRLNRRSYERQGASLTDSEQAVALLVGKGYTDKQIGRVLGYSHQWVSLKVSAILRKNGFQTRTQIAVAYYGAKQTA